MNDQYGNEIPDDLVLLPRYDSLDDMEVAIVMAASWYEAKGILMASAAQLEGLSEDDPEDAGVDLIFNDIMAVSDALKRGNPVDGFYHA